MNRTAMPTRTVAASVAALSLLALAGCAPGPYTFTFVDGQTLDEDTKVDWNDGLQGDAEWEEQETGQGESGRSYRRIADDCIAGYSVTDDMNYGTPFAEDDDLDASNGVMNLVIDFQTAPPTTGKFPLEGDLGNSVAMRQVTFAQDGESGVFAGRSFDVPGITVIAFASCPDEDDITDAFGALLAKSSVVITP
ncbi:hypothetical protein [Microbacterium sp. NPDC087868]|uniref:hypothetical protein n=1 Tax=Microbacterium sp. NPDC087868 TaxID=3364195 RepID=UPI00384B7BEB